MRCPRDETRGREDAERRENACRFGRLSDGTDGRVKPTIEQDQYERDRTQPERHTVILERNATDSLRTGKHPNDQKHQCDRHRKPLRGAAEDDAHRKQNAEGGEKQRCRERLGAGHLVT